MIATNVILTSLCCARCDSVGRLIRQDLPKKAPEGLKEAEYFYTLRCPTCGEIELWGLVKRGGKPGQN
jgi:hypothetical protein